MGLGSIRKNQLFSGPICSRGEHSRHALRSAWIQGAQPQQELTRYMRVFRRLFHALPKKPAQIKRRSAPTASWEFGGVGLVFCLVGEGLVSNLTGLPPASKIMPQASNTTFCSLVAGILFGWLSLGSPTDDDNDNSHF